jgi:cytochrome c oxidase subunit 2
MFRDRLKTPSGKLWLGVFGVFVAMTIVLLVFGWWWPTASMPQSSSTTMNAVRTTMLVFSLAAAPVMALVWAIAYYSLRHWGHGGDTPPEDGPPIRGNNKVAITWILVSSVLTAFLLIWGLAAMSADAISPTATPVIVEVTGQQWLWSFAYPDNGKISNDDLYLPVNKPVVFKVSSTDVIHSFWLPQMGIKVDANPGVTTTTSTTPTRIGTFDVRCAELCGLNHAFMQTHVHVLSVADYNAWIESQGGKISPATAAGSNNNG